MPCNEVYYILEFKKLLVEKHKMYDNKPILQSKKLIIFFIWQVKFDPCPKHLIINYIQFNNKKIEMEDSINKVERY